MIKLHALGCAVWAVALSQTHAYAQPFEISRVNHSFGATMTTDVAYDPVHDGYFVITGDPMVKGQFVDRSGRPSGPPITLDTRRSPYVSRAVYSPDVSDGAGGRGGFLALWSPTFDTGGVVVQRVSVRGGLIGSPQTIATGFVINVDAAYSLADQVFFVGVRDQRGPWDSPTRMIRLNVEGLPLGEIGLSTVPNASCFHELISACEVHVEWNPVFGEFAVVYSQGQPSAFANSSLGSLILARVRGNGQIVSRTVIGLSASTRTALAVNTHTGHYLVLTMSAQRVGGVDGVELGPDGAILARGLISGDLNVLTGGFDFIALRLSYSPASGTFLLGAGIAEAPGMNASVLLELNQHGVPLFTRPFPDPFTSLGGGVCVNGGWVPRGHPLAGGGL